MRKNILFFLIQYLFIITMTSVQKSEHLSITFKTDFCFIYDTPGFSSFDIDYLKPKDISVFFPGYDTIFNRCYFNNCLHEKEKGCEVIKQVDEGHLSFDSYENYLKILKEVKSFDVWKKKI